MTIVESDILPVTPTVVVADRKPSLIDMDMSESLFGMVYLFHSLHIYMLIKLFNRL